MIVFVGDRASGKTYQLIKYANENNLTIVCRDPLHIIDEADNMNIVLEKIPMSYTEYQHKFLARGAKNTVNVVIDDIEAFLQYTNPNLVGFTFDNSNYVERAKITFNEDTGPVHILDSK